MESTTEGQSGPRGARKRRLLALGGVCATAATAATIAFSGTAAAAPDSGMVPGTPCHIGTAACVQLGKDGFNGKAWFIRNHKVVRGPVPVATGGPGKDTTVGSFPVTIKDVDHVSSETTDSEGNPSEMPYSVFYGRKGEAFHGGGKPTARTAGCIRLRDADASYFYNNLQKGDRVEIVSRSAASSAPDDQEADTSSRDDENDDDNNNDDDGPGGLLGGL